MSKTDKVGEGVMFKKYARITGYLTTTVDRWNNAKRAEERERVKHTDLCSTCGK